MSTIEQAGAEVSDLPAAEPFEFFYRREYSRAVAIARSLLPTASAAEDLVQEAFAAAHSRWDRVGRYERPEAWLRRVLINKATSLLRRNSVEWRAVNRLGAMTDGATTPDLSVETRELWAEVRKLPKRQAQSVALFYVGELTVEEIGDALGCSPGTVKSHLFRARERLTERLNPWKEES